MEETKQYIAIFRNAREVIKADRLCAEASICITVIPVPESLSLECGMCLLLSSKVQESFIQLMKLNKITPQLHERNKL